MRLCLTLLVILSTALYIEGNAVHPKKSQRPVRTKAVKEYVLINNQTFYFGINDLVTWYVANARCADLGMQLLTLDTQEKYDMMLNWIGSNPDYDVWLWTSGVRASFSADWYWFTSQANFTFSSWGEGEPSRVLSGESCMNFLASWGFWDDDPCSGSISPWESFDFEYVCEEISK